MTVDIAQQGRALCQALLLGAALGVTYDLFRILRVRIRVPLLGPLLDLLFWLLATLALFLWSQDAWGGQIRLYGAAFCLLGGSAYFWVISRWFLKLGYLCADVTGLLLGILTFPLGIARRFLKKIRKLIKNTFLSGAKWYRIGQKTSDMERAVRRRAARERGEMGNAVQTSRISDQDCGFGSADLHDHLSHRHARPDSGRRKSAGRPGPGGVRVPAVKSGAGRVHRKQRRS